MALFSIPGLRLAGVAAAVPARVVDNAMLAERGLVLDPGFERAVGIRARRVASPGLTASDLCVAAARALFERAEIAPETIGALVFVTQTPDQPIPGNGALTQHRLGLAPSTFVLDVNQGCAGYVYGLASLALLMHGAGIERGLLLAGDTITRLLHPNDAGTVPLFSDAGSATLLERASDGPPMAFNLGGDGSAGDVIAVKFGGARAPLAPEMVGRDDASPWLSMRGLDVLHYTSKYVEPNVRELLGFAGVDAGAPDYFLFHQANRVVNAALARRLGVPEHRAPETLSVYGNTSSATIPVTIAHRLSAVLAAGCHTLVLAGFGSGFSYGSALVHTSAVLGPGVIEVGEP